MFCMEGSRSQGGLVSIVPRVIKKKILGELNLEQTFLNNEQDETMLKSKKTLYRTYNHSLK